MNWKDFGRNSNVLVDVIASSFEGGRVAIGNALKNRNHEGDALAPQKHKPRMSHLQELVQRALENVIVLPLAKEYTPPYVIHRFMIVLRGACLFSTH
jgi:hypothetical protein